MTIKLNGKNLGDDALVIAKKSQSDLELIVKQLNNNPFLTGRLIKNVSVGTSETLIAHGLQRDFQGFIVVRKYADRNLWCPSGETYNKSLYIGLLADASATFDIWVF
jgi:hypothetical protein